MNKITLTDEKVISGKNIELATTANNIKINFTVLSHISNKRFKVLYTINNSKWNRLDAENRNLILSALSPNNYEIKLKIDDKSNKTIERLILLLKNLLGSIQLFMWDYRSHFYFFL